jgi:hypothetical protein
MHNREKLHQGHPVLEVSMKSLLDFVGPMLVFGLIFGCVGFGMGLSTSLADACSIGLLAFAGGCGTALMSF